MFRERAFSLIELRSSLLDLSPGNSWEFFKGKEENLIRSHEAAWVVVLPNGSNLCMPSLA
mgnify:CR=1 FL=1